MNYSFGTIVIVPFPFVSTSGETQQKARPACVLTNEDTERRYEDAILAAITSQIPNQILELEIRIQATEDNGLVKDSLLRLDFVMTLPESIISRKIGELSNPNKKKVSERLKRSFGYEDLQ